MFRLFILLTALSWGQLSQGQADAQPGTHAITATDSPPLQLLASVRPIALLAQELTRNTDVQVVTLMPSGATPHDYALKPSDLQAIQQADLLVWLGEQEEPYLQKVAQRAKAIIAWQTLPGLNLLPLRDAMHQPNNTHDQHQQHASQDLHIWFDSRNALLLAQQLQEKLVAMRPQLAPTINQNLQQITQSIEQQKEQTRAILAEQIQPFLLAHDAYQYLEADLGVQSVGAVVLSPEIKPGARHLMELKQEIQQQKVACVITGPEVSSALLDKIDSHPPMVRIGIDPLAWDFEGDQFSLWLASVYVKMVVCGVEGYPHP